MKNPVTATIAAIFIAASANAQDCDTTHGLPALSAALNISDHRQSQSARNAFSGAVLVRLAHPDAALKPLDAAHFGARNGKNFNFLAPTVEVVASSGKGAVKTVAKSLNETVNASTIGNISRVLPAIAKFTGEYTEASAVFPIGKGVYSQNILPKNMISTLAGAGHWDAAKDLYFRHQFGYHSHQMIALLARFMKGGQTDAEIFSFLDQVQLQIDEYRSDGGYDLCRSERTQKECDQKLSEHPRHRRLQAFDSQSYLKCFLTPQRKKAAQEQCLAAIETRADAANFVPDTETYYGDALSYAAQLVVLEHRALAGDPRPDLVPQEAILAIDNAELAMHMAIMSALAITQSDSRAQSYWQHLQENGQVASGGILPTKFYLTPQQLADFALYDMMRRRGDIEGLWRAARTDELSASGAAHAQLRLWAAQTGDVALLAQIESEFTPTLDDHMTVATLAERSGHSEITNQQGQKALELACHQGTPAKLITDHGLTDVQWLAIFRAVQSGKLPRTALR